MAELLIRTVDKSCPEDARNDALLSKRGDVITIQPDGWTWSEAERNAPHWVIVKVPGVSVDDLTAYVTPDPGDEIGGKLPQRRAFHFDLGAWEKGGRKALKRADALAHKKARAQRRHPDVFGHDVEALG